MPLRRLLNTFGLAPSQSPAEEDVLMSDATKAVTTTTSCQAVKTPSPSTSCPTSLGKRRHVEPSSEPDSIPTPMISSDPTSVLSPSADLSAPAPAKKRHIFTLAPIDTTPEPSLSHPTPSELNSPAPTEIALDAIEYIEPTPEERIRALQAEGIKVRDFAHESPLPSSSKAPEVFDPLPSLIATDWHMRNPDKNRGMLSGKALFRLIKLGWLSMGEVAKRVHVREFTALAQYSDRPDEERYPFVVAPSGPIPTPSQRVRMRRNAGFRSHPDDLPDREFFGYDPTGHSDEEQQPPVLTDTEAGEPVVKRRKLKSRAKPLSRTKPLRKEYSRPEV